MKRTMMAVILALAVAVPGTTVPAEVHEHFYVWDDVADYNDIGNGEYHQVIFNYRRGTCTGCEAVKIDTSNQGKIWLETHSFNGNDGNGHPKCTDCGYVELAPWLPGCVEDGK